MNLEMILEIIKNLFLGMLPETIYFTIFLVYTKNIKEEKFKIFKIICIAYIFCIMIVRLKTFYYVCFIFITYLLLKIIYKKKIELIDIFAFSISTIYLTLLSYICFYFMKSDYTNYYILFLINRILLFLPFAFRKYFHIWYNKYKSLWNRNDAKNNPIKSITIRNISLITINISIFLLNFILILI